MSIAKSITRRQFLHASALATAGVLAAACTPTSTMPGDDAQPVPAVAPGAADAPALASAKYSEAPSLAALVAEGKLPPIEERLPVEPFVVGPGVLVHEQDLDWEIGDYSREGEVLRSVTTSPTWSYPCQHATERFLSSPCHYTGPITGSLCSSWSVNDNCTVYEFTLRKGLRWSDGVPVTTEDIRFAYEDVVMNEQLTPALGQALRSGNRPDGEPLRVEIVDDFTFRVSFVEPNGRFLYTMGMGSGWTSYTTLLKPKHYLQQFHKDYAAADELAAKVRAAGLSAEEWHRLFLEEGGNWGGMGCEQMAEEGRMPVLRPWVIKPSSPDLIVMERNPYYHKVDVEGKQLPYVERIEGVVVSDPENIPMKIIAGEGNYIRERLRHTDVALYKEHEQEHGYAVNLNLVYHNAPVALFINLTNPDESWRQIVWQKEFRYAINATIDFREIVDALYLGMGTVAPVIPDVFDRDLANTLLDQVGLNQRDAEGWRIGPDGNRFEVRMDVALDPLFTRPAEIIKAHLEEVGLSCPLRMMEGALWTQMRDANQLYTAIQWSNDCQWPYIWDDYMPDQRIRWAQSWHTWMRTKGAEGEEPPDWIKELYALDTEIKSVNPNTARAEDAERRLLEWFMEYVPFLPVARDVADPCIVPANAGNIARSGRSSAVWFSQEQVFFRHT